MLVFLNVGYVLGESSTCKTKNNLKQTYIQFNIMRIKLENLNTSLYSS